MMNEKDAHAEAVALRSVGYVTRVVEVWPGHYRVQAGDGGGTWWSVPEGVTAVNLAAWGGGAAYNDGRVWR